MLMKRFIALKQSRDLPVDFGSGLLRGCRTSPEDQSSDDEGRKSESILHGSSFKLANESTVE